MRTAEPAIGCCWWNHKLHEEHWQPHPEDPDRLICPICHPLVGTPKFEQAMKATLDASRR